MAHNDKNSAGYGGMVYFILCAIICRLFVFSNKKFTLSENSTDFILVEIWKNKF